MKPLLLTIALLFSTPAWASQVIKYSVLYEEDGNGILLINDHADGVTRGVIIEFGGYKWFKAVFEKVNQASVFLTPTKLTQKGNMWSYLQQRYQIGNFRYEFKEDDGGDQYLNFLSKEATNKIKAYINKNQSFVISGRSNAWYAGTFYAIKNTKDLLKLSNLSPTTFCNLISIKMVNNTQNHHIKTNNLKLYMKNQGLECDNFNNIIIPKDKNETSPDAKLLQENNDPFANKTKPNQPSKLDPFR
ncbi:MAG: hypothetical protein ACON33_04570 [Candidatus Micropelagos thuwalensis]